MSGDLGPATPIRDAAARILAAKAVPLFALEAAAAGGDDMDAVHDMRVASRRLRAALSVFRDHLPKRRRKRWAKVARSVTRALGAVRDADVFLAEFTTLGAAASDPGERRAIAALVARRRAQRAEDLAQMRAILEGLGLQRRHGAFLRFAASAKGGGTPLHDLASETVASRLEALYSLLPAALAPEASAAQHAARIAAKRLRYAIETLRPCFDDSVLAVLAYVRSLQDVLGELHDRDIFLALVAEAAHDPALAAAGVTPDGLAAVERRLAAERDQRFAAFAGLAAERDAASMRTALQAALLPL